MGTGTYKEERGRGQGGIVQGGNTVTVILDLGTCSMYTVTKLGLSIWFPPLHALSRGFEIYSKRWFTKVI